MKCAGKEKLLWGQDTIYNPLFVSWFFSPFPLSLLKLTSQFSLSNLLKLGEHCVCITIEDIGFHSFRYDKGWGYCWKRSKDVNWMVGIGISRTVKSYLLFVRLQSVLFNNKKILSPLLVLLRYHQPTAICWVGTYTSLWLYTNNNEKRMVILFARSVQISQTFAVILCSHQWRHNMSVYFKNSRHRTHSKIKKLSIPHKTYL